MRPLALAAAATFAIAALACGGEPDPAQSDGGATDTSPDVVANPQVYFVQIDT